MHNDRSRLAEIAKQIEAQAFLMRASHDSMDKMALHARLESIRQFACQGIHLLEDEVLHRPSTDSAASVE